MLYAISQMVSARSHNAISSQSNNNCVIQLQSVHIEMYVEFDQCEFIEFLIDICQTPLINAIALQLLFKQLSSRTIKQKSTENEQKTSVNDNMHIFNVCVSAFTVWMRMSDLVYAKRVNREWRKQICLYCRSENIFLRIWKILWLFLEFLFLVLFIVSIFVQTFFLFFQFQSKIASHLVKTSFRITENNTKIG